MRQRSTLASGPLLLLLLAAAACVPPTTEPSFYPRPAGAPAGAPAGGYGGPAGDGTAEALAGEGMGEEAGYAEAEAAPGGPAAAPVAAGPAPARPAAAGASRLTITPPAGFTQNEGWWVTSTREARWQHDIITAGMARTLPGVAISPDAGAALRALWDSSMPPQAKGMASGLVYRRLIGDGLLAYYLHGNGSVQGDQPTGHWFTLYLVDCGSTWEPLIVGSMYQHTTTGGFFSTSVGPGMAEGLTRVEPLLDSVRCDGPRNPPIVPPQHVVGHYYYGSGASQDFINVYTGATGYYALSYAGEYDLRADGTVSYEHSSATTVTGSTAFQGEKSTGTWSVQADLLVLELTTLRRTKRFRIASVTDFPGERVMILLDDRERADPDTVRRGTYLTTKKKQ